MKATWEEQGVMVRRCGKCRDVKPLEEEFYIDGRREGMGRWRYYCKTCDRLRMSDQKKKATAAMPVAERRAKWADQKREWKQRNPEAVRAASKRYRDRIMADPKRHAEYLETCRIEYRLREEAKGRDLSDIRSVNVHALPPRGVLRLLPAAPLARAVEALIARDELEGNDQARDMVCGRASIPARTLFAWTHGERTMVRFDVADRVVTRLDLQWWDVWDDPAATSVWEGRAAA